MTAIPRRRRSIASGGASLAIFAIVLSVLAPASRAAGPPIVVSTWASSVFSSSARLHAQVNPNGLSTSYHFDYISAAGYQANVASSKDPFTGASRIPVSVDANIGSGTLPVNVLQLLSGLASDTTYHYRLAARNAATSPAYTFGSTLSFTTQMTGGAADGCPNADVRGQQGSAYLADCRAYEMISPVDKNGGQAPGPGRLADGGSLQAAGAGGLVTFGSETSFGEGAEGAPPVSQYLASRGGGGWILRNISPPLYSGSYDREDVGSSYRIFSSDLSRGILLSGERCRGDASGCPVANPSIAGTNAPAGYRNYYLRDNATGAYAAVLGSANSGFLTLDPAQFDLDLAGVAPDLRHGVVSTCAALTANATEVPAGEGCDPAQANLYEYAPTAGLTLVNVLPSETQGTPGAQLAATVGAISADGSRVYFTHGGNLYLREGSTSKQVDSTVGGGGVFETASADGSVAYFTKAGHLYRYLAATGVSTDLTPSGGLLGVLGASENGDRVYFEDGSGLKRWHSGATATVAADADPVNYPPATGAARVSADGTKLLFVATASLTGYDNADLATAEPDSQVYLHDASGPSLTCVSCNPTNGRPIGPSTVPGAVPNGSGSDAFTAYKPRVLSTSGRRVFFFSEDALAFNDTNKRPDVYEWERQGEGTCTRPAGCVSLISSGRTTGETAFVDASADGSEAFFVTDESLVGADGGAVDLYVARTGGGFLEPRSPESCEGDRCQSLPSPPIDPTLTTLLFGPGNPGVRYPGESKRCAKGKVRRKGKCVRKKRGKGTGGKQRARRSR